LFSAFSIDDSVLCSNRINQVISEFQYALNKNQLPPLEKSLEFLRLPEDFQPDLGYSQYRLLKAALKKTRYDLDSNLYAHLKTATPGGRDFLKTLKSALRCDEGNPGRYRAYKKSLRLGTTAEQIENQANALLAKAKAKSLALEFEAKLKLTEIEKKQQEAQDQTQSMIDTAQNNLAQSITTAKATEDDALKASSDVLSDAKQQSEVMLKTATLYSDQLRRETERKLETFYLQEQKKKVINEQIAQSRVLVYNIHGAKYFALREDIDQYVDYLSSAASGRWSNFIGQDDEIVIKNLLPNEFEILLQFHQGNYNFDPAQGLKAGTAGGCHELMNLCNMKLSLSHLLHELKACIDRDFIEKQRRIGHYEHSYRVQHISNEYHFKINSDPSAAEQLKREKQEKITTSAAQRDHFITAYQNRASQFTEQLTASLDYYIHHYQGQLAEIIPFDDLRLILGKCRECFLSYDAETAEQSYQYNIGYDDQRMLQLAIEHCIYDLL